MIQNPTCNVELPEALPHISEFRRICRVLLSRRVVCFCLVIILALILVAIFAPQIAPYDPYEQNLSNRLLGSSSEHLLGTDYLGRDILSRMIYGSQTALMVGLVAICIAASIGITLGLIAGYFGGISYVVIMRLVDALMSIPLLVNALVLAV